ncbi:MAG: bestrophin family ion channel [Saprospiraceae bacterium]
MILTKKIEIARLYEYTKKNGWFLVITCLLAGVSIMYIDPVNFKAISYPSGVIGTALVFSIGFRNNTAYTRWWEIGNRTYRHLQYWWLREQQISLKMKPKNIFPW